ncbi:hypothetical protein ERT44_18990 [Stenotrophomonas sp. MA5]|uniref:hypothetical protein n=1 Tax=Stenotrophomonas maltophilia TaxID=40324 RepID=UPI000C25D47B|nr:hypothetical protein [Stenotrophomonas maltophilia]PJL44188.1 hypothetical protein B9Y56_05675 [Stenotrophomonas maltophilia]RXK63131.1 hypothetical protein ERT44_18990 [Stenotrophomonas sp. MA5]
MALPLAELLEKLNALEAELPSLIQAYPDPADFWPAFAGLADLIEDEAGLHSDEVAGRIDALLARHNLRSE